MPLCKGCMEQAETVPYGGQSGNISHFEREYKTVEGVCSRCGGSPVHEVGEIKTVYKGGEKSILARVWERFQ